MILPGTDILVYATIPAFEEHKRARSILEDVHSGRSLFCVTWVNIFEYSRIVTHRRLVEPIPLPISKAPANVKDLMDSPQVSRIDPGEAHDCRIAAIMRENGVAHTMTRDIFFRRIRGIEVIDPFACE